MKKTFDDELTVVKSVACIYVCVLPPVVTSTDMLDISVFALGKTNDVLAVVNAYLWVRGVPSVISI